MNGPRRAFTNQETQSGRILSKKWCTWSENSVGSERKWMLRAMKYSNISPENSYTGPAGRQSSILSVTITNPLENLIERLETEHMPRFMSTIPSRAVWEEKQRNNLGSERRTSNSTRIWDVIKEIGKVVTILSSRLWKILFIAQFPATRLPVIKFSYHLLFNAHAITITLSDFFIFT